MEQVHPIKLRTQATVSRTDKMQPRGLERGAKSILTTTLVRAVAGSRHRLANRKVAKKRALFPLPTSNFH
jgi:hypothetical protein